MSYQWVFDRHLSYIIGFRFLIVIILLNVLIAVVSDSYANSLVKSKQLYLRTYFGLTAELDGVFSILGFNDDIFFGVKSEKEKSEHSSFIFQALACCCRFSCNCITCKFCLPETKTSPEEGAESTSCFSSSLRCICTLLTWIWSFINSLLFLVIVPAVAVGFFILVVAFVAYVTGWLFAVIAFLLLLAGIMWAMGFVKKVKQTSVSFANSLKKNKDSEKELNKLFWGLVFILPALFELVSGRLRIRIESESADGEWAGQAEHITTEMDKRINKMEERMACLMEKHFAELKSISSGSGAK